MKIPIKINLAVAILMAVVAGWITFRFVPAPLPELSREQFLKEVREGHVQKVAIVDQQYITSSSSTRGPFHTSYNKEADARLAGELRKLGVEVVFESSGLGI